MQATWQSRQEGRNDGNFVRTGVLLAAMTALFMAVGYFIGGTGGMMTAFVVALGLNLFSYWNSDKLVLSMQGARADRSALARPTSTAWSNELAQNAGIPTPRIYVIETEQPNAFATGRNPQNAAVAVSRGLLKALEPREVAAVVAHELAHIRSRDTLTMTITATLAGAISMLAQFGLFFGGGNNRNNPLGGIGTLLMVFLAPVAAALVQMAISRTREYEADKDGAGDLRRSACARLGAEQDRATRADRHGQRRGRAQSGDGALYIFNPLSGARMDNLFSTHPAVENRIAQLQKIAGAMQAVAPAPR